MAAVDSPRIRRSPPPSAPSPALVGEIHIGEDAFISEATVEEWARAGAASRTGNLLAIRGGRLFLVRDAVRVLGRRNGDTDPYGLTGRVEAIRDFIRRGAAISTDALRLGPAVYDIEYGVVAVSAPAGRGA